MKPDRIEANPRTDVSAALGSCIYRLLHMYAHPRCISLDSKSAFSSGFCSDRPPQLTQEQTPFWIGRPPPSLHFVLWFMGLKCGISSSHPVRCWPEQQAAFLRNGQLISWLKARISLLPFLPFISSARALRRTRAEPRVNADASGTKALAATDGKHLVLGLFLLPGQP